MRETDETDEDRSAVESEVECQLTADDYVRAHFLHWRPGPRMRWLLATVFVLFAGSTAIAVLSVLTHGRGFQALLIVASLLLYIVALFFGFMPWRARKVFRQQKSLHLSYRIVIAEDGVQTLNAVGSSRLLWSHMVRWKEDEALIILYHSDVSFLLLPKRVLDDRGASALRAQLEHHLGSAA